MRVNTDALQLRIINLTIEYGREHGVEWKLGPVMGGVNSYIKMLQALNTEPSDDSFRAKNIDPLGVRFGQWYRSQLSMKYGADMNIDNVLSMHGDILSSATVRRILSGKCKPRRIRSDTITALALLIDRDEAEITRKIRQFQSELAGERKGPSV